MPKLSLIIPALNEEKNLRRLLSSISNKEQEFLEIVIIDDFRTVDKTKSILKKFEKLKIIYVSTNESKVPSKRNLGAKKSKGKYLFFADADMEFPNSFFSFFISELEFSKPDLVFVPERTPISNWISSMKNYEKFLIEDNTDLSAARVVKRSIFKKIGGYNQNLGNGEDIDFSHRAKEVSSDILISKLFVNHYETSGQSLVRHLIKKYNYGQSTSAYFQSYKKNRITNSILDRFYYFKPNFFVKSPIKHSQFIFFKSAELLIMTTGLIKSKL